MGREDQDEAFADSERPGGEHRVSDRTERDEPASPRLRQAIENKFPYFVARSFYQLRGTDNWLAQIPQLANVLGVTLEHLAILAFAEYLACDIRDNSINSKLNEAFKKPISHGTWAGLLREMLTFLDARSQEMFIPELRQLYFLSDPKQGANSLKGISDELVQLRNDLLKRSAESLPTYEKYRRFKSRLIEFLQAIAFVKDYPLVSVVNTTTQGGIKTHACRLHLGFHDTFEQVALQCNLDLEHSWVAMLNPREGRLLYLYPFYSISECQEAGCGSLHLFRFERIDKARIEYVSTGGHRRRDEAAGAHLARMLQMAGGVPLHQRADYLCIEFSEVWHPLSIGQRIDKKYEIVEHLRRGGMADVYKVKDLRAGIHRALKLLPFQFLSDRVMIQRFRQESMQAREFDHPNITRMLDYGEDVADHYLVMELADGWKTSGAQLALDVGMLAKPLDEMTSISIVKQACEGLDYIHNKNIIHRDIKPGNLLLFQGGRVKLTDFGIARSLQAMKLTITGLTVGTPEYMSPEQADGKRELAPASDIYSLGIVLYELLTGQSPFKRDSALATAVAHLQDPVPAPRVLNPAIPAALQRIVLKCLAKAPDERFKSAKALYQALNTYQETGDWQDPQSSDRSKQYGGLAAKSDIRSAIWDKRIIGKTVLHYRILKEIGKGGMGVVYKAEDTKLHRAVAVKVLAADLVGDEKARARFLREARAASAIDHPNICTIHEVNEVDGNLFFVMQYVEGETLKKFIAGRPLPLDQALEFSLQLTDALAEAHRRNVVHRDIKSSNIMLNERHQLKILDFGLAKLMETTESRGGPNSYGELDQVSSPFGTASYMSPEQARGEIADSRSDLFSMGVVMYEMLTGRLPFKGKSSVDVLHAVMHYEPAPLGVGYPPRLQLLLSKALAKDKNARYQSADLLLEDLRALVRAHYVEQGVIPSDKAARLQASKQPRKGKGILGRMSDWVQRTFQPVPVVEEESEESSDTPDITPSMWQSRDKKAIAILPFKNLSGSPEDDFYSFSLADSVITELAQLRDLVVRPSSYIVQYQNKDVDPRAVGTQLSVDAVLVGGYIKSGDRFRVTPQLVDVNTGEIVWSEKIDVDARDIIMVQDTISNKIVEGLRVKTSSTEQQRLVKSPTDSVEAYENYLKGRTTLYKFVTQTLDYADLNTAIELFGNSIKIDPGFALAHSGLGVCYLNYVLNGMGGVEYYGKAREAFDHALEIDSKLVEPRVRMIHIDLIEGRSDMARSELRLLLMEAPNEPSVHSTAAYVYRLSGQYRQAMEAWDRYLKISPTDIVVVSYNRARIYIYERDYGNAEAEITKGLAYEPHHSLLRAFGAVIKYYRGEIETATIELEVVLSKNPHIHTIKLFLAVCYL
jgi:serine/threonine-protein kinase